MEVSNLNSIIYLTLLLIKKTQKNKTKQNKNKKQKTKTKTNKQNKTKNKKKNIMLNVWYHSVKCVILFLKSTVLKQWNIETQMQILIAAKDTEW